MSARAAFFFLLLGAACSRKPAPTVEQAAAKGDVAQVRKLAAAAPAAVKGEAGRRAVLAAARAGNKEAVRALIELGAPAQEAAVEAAKDGDTGAALSVLDLSSELGRRGSSGPLNEHGDFLIIQAVQAAAGAGQGATARALLARAGTSDAALKKLVMSLPDRPMRISGPAGAHKAAPSGQTAPGELEHIVAPRPQGSVLPGRAASAMFLAASRGDAKKVRELADAGEKIDLEDEQGRTPLMVAAEGGFTGTVLALLEKGAELEKQNRRAPPGLLGVSIAQMSAGVAPSEKAAPGLPGAKGELAAGAAHQGATALIAAASGGKAQTVLLLVGKGANVEAADARGQTALMYAAVHGSAAALVALLDRGARVDTQAADGSTALMLAVQRGRTESALELLKRKPKLDAADERGQTALMAACAFGRLQLVKTMLDGGASTEVHDAIGQTALHFAALAGRADIVKLLVDGGAHAEAKTESGITALMAAAQKGDAETIRLLLANPRVKVDAATRTGATALMYAAEGGHDKAVLALLDAGAAVDAREKEAGWTALMVASARGKSSVAKILLARGADPKAVDAKGRTASEIAKASGF